MKLWGGRFSKETDKGVNDFNSSISFDARMYKEDIEGSIAHVTMLGEQDIIPGEAAGTIAGELRRILADIEAGKVEFLEDAEDIHMNIEHILTERLGDVGKMLHTGRSRNDQVALDIRMHLKKEITAIKGLILELVTALADIAGRNTLTVMPGYTHLQRAQPVSLAHHLMAYCEMLRRDIGRLEDTYKRTDIMPLGSGALAGTTYPLNRARVAELLGFSGITANSMDGVSDRDFVLELCSALSILMVHLSRFSEEIILWCSHEFRFIELDDAFATGSSIMPQKKNPDVAELIRGKSGRVIGDMVTLYTMMKGIPLAYNKDMQEDKEAVFDAVDNVKLCVGTFTGMVKTMTVLPDNMRRAASSGFINATDCADYLTKRGVPFRDAYTITGRLVRYCTEQGKTLETLSLEEYNTFGGFDEDIFEAIKLETCLNGRNIPGGPAEPAVREHIGAIRTFLEEQK